jgi:hypothetical protein
MVYQFIKVKFIGKGSRLSLLNDKIYDARPSDKGWYGIVDETGEEYAYPPEVIEVVESQVNESTK